MEEHKKNVHRSTSTQRDRSNQLPYTIPYDLHRNKPRHIYIHGIYIHPKIRVTALEFLISTKRTVSTSRYEQETGILA